MGINTEDSITIAPIRTLTDREHQYLRDQTKIVMDIVGVEMSGSNIQFTMNPEDGTIMVIEMNLRVSRSSALTSKVTGFPIAIITAWLGLSFRLDEIHNDVT
jgi:carbamoyl-phosphate synthase large subunit